MQMFALKASVESEKKIQKFKRLYIEIIVEMVIKQKTDNCASKIGQYGEEYKKK